MSKSINTGLKPGENKMNHFEAKSHQDLLADNESHSVNRAAPNRTKSFSKNPPAPESAGKPPRLCSQPGSENKKVSVAKNVKTASTLPTADNFAESGRIAINIAAQISVTPITFDVACKLR